MGYLQSDWADQRIGAIHSAHLMVECRAAARAPAG
eukprot:SAG31_NODE_6573_length_1967_cov_19.547919_1_plen_34_part_10